jgi:hypothetical protein
MSDNEVKIFPDGQRRISSRALARRLGMSHEELCRLIETHRDELSRYGPLIQFSLEERTKRNKKNSFPRERKCKCQEGLSGCSRRATSARVCRNGWNNAPVHPQVHVS